VSPPRITARAVLVDIEGTTSTIAFVHDVLFPYADEHLDAYVAAHRGDPEVAKAMYDAAMLAGEDMDTDDATILWHLHHWLREDIKATPLKTLQGLIWAEGFAQNRLRGHVYPDAATGLRRWRDAALRLYVYSSGSIEAQKVLFGNSVQGDLSTLFSGHFDTTTGPKRVAASYTAIADSIGLPAADVVFLSDVDAELDAARTAGMQTVRLLRLADTPPGATTTHPSATTFDQIEITSPPF
jgi:enolase-phosphatase E1